jgi:general secretion pathway protein C
MPLANAPAAPTVSVSKWHLFGSAAVVRAEVRNAPATQLRLLLKGTVAEGDPLAGMAVIADESGVERAYRSGESVPGGATLQEIYPDRVILQHEGVSETLNLPDQGVAAASAPAAASGPPPRGLAGISGAPAPAGGALPNNVLFVPPPPTGQVDYSKLQQQFGVDPASLARQVTALPVMVNGKMTGVRLSGGPEALMSKLGLKADDVVTAVNGIPLDSPARLPQLQDSLKSASQITATVLRDGKPTTLSVTVK